MTHSYVRCLPFAVPSLIFSSVLSVFMGIFFWVVTHVFEIHSSNHTQTLSHSNVLSSPPLVDLSVCRSAGLLVLSTGPLVLSALSVSLSVMSVNLMKSGSDVNL